MKVPPTEAVLQAALFNTPDGGIDWTALGTIVALLAAVGSFILTMRGQKQDRELAENSAARAEAAAALSEDYTARVVEALERIAANGGVGGGATALTPRVKWSMRHSRGDTYILENQGDAPAAGVRLESHPSLLRVGIREGGPDLGPGEALTFMAVRTDRTTDSTITVRWGEPDGSRGEWRYPLPAKPK